jgi:hypothetical protein
LLKSSESSLHIFNPTFNLHIQTRTSLYSTTLPPLSLPTLITLLLHFIKPHFNIIIPSTPKSYSPFLPQISLPKLPTIATYSANLIFLPLIILTTFAEKYAGLHHAAFSRLLYYPPPRPIYVLCPNISCRTLLSNTLTRCLSLRNADSHSHKIHKDIYILYCVL